MFQHIADNNTDINTRYADHVTAFYNATGKYPAGLGNGYRLNEATKFLRREMDVSEFRAMTRTLREFLGAIIADAGGLSRNLSEVLLAQEYQDLTGQVIHRVMGIVQEVEDGLVETLRVVGQRPGAAPAPAAASSGHGPQIDPKKPDVVANQDEVDRPAFEPWSEGPDHGIRSERRNPAGLPGQLARDPRRARQAAGRARTAPG